jgi:MFS family permease
MYYHQVCLLLNSTGNTDKLCSICFGLFLSLLDTTIVATALYTIGVDLKSLDAVNWVALAYTLAYLGCAVIFARISDIIGRRNTYVAAFLIFFAFSIGCGFSKTLNQLIACRALQGVGGSGLYSLTFVILPEVAPENVQRWIAALAGGVVAMSGVLGPVLGGVITDYTTWRVSNSFSTIYVRQKENFSPRRYSHQVTSQGPSTAIC